MPLKTVLAPAILSAVLIAGLSSPIWAVCGYAVDYSVGLGRKWWMTPLTDMGLRVSLTLAGAIALGLLLNYSKLKRTFGTNALASQEKLVLLFLGIVWLSSMLGETTIGRYTLTDHPTIKMTKVAIFVFLLAHVATTLKDLNLLIWAMILGALWLGVDAYETPRRAFAKGRLEGIGGPDFSDANFFAAYMATMLPLIGVQFLRSRWRGKLVCLAAGVFATNAIILTRSRGAFVGLGVGIVAAVLLAPVKYRSKILAGIVLAGLGAVYLADPQFVERMTTITRSEEERDQSAASRLALAEAGARMLMDHPLGIGAGNFYQTIGRYIPAYQGKDAHNTYVRCFTELGLQGFAVFALLILNGFHTLWNLRKKVANLPSGDDTDLQMLVLGAIVALATLLGCCLTMSLVYVEFLWWLLILPVCLCRALDNHALQLVEEGSLHEAEDPEGDPDSHES
jgi:O-antigen ligase